MRRLILACLIGAVAQSALAAEPIASIVIPKVSCKVAGCASTGTVQLSGAAGTIVPAGTILTRWDGATFSTVTAATLPSAVGVTSPSSGAIYDVPAGEALTAPAGITATVSSPITRYVIGNGAGAVQFAGVTVTIFDDLTVTPASVNVSMTPSYPAEFAAAVRQHTLTRALLTGVRNQGLSLAAGREIIQLSLTPPRDAVTDGTAEAVTAFAFDSNARAAYQAPNYTEPRIAGPYNLAQGREVCGFNSVGPCVSRVADVRPENLSTVYYHCTRESTGAGFPGIDGNCPWLAAHDFVRWYAVALPLSGRCLAEPDNAQRVFSGYVGDALGCRYVYGGDVLPPEAEEAIFEVVLNDIKARL